MAQYIDKDALVAEIEKKRDAALTRQRNLEAIGQVTVLNETLARELSRIISFINTLEVKDVDLDFQTFAKEMDAVFALPSTETKNTEENPLNWEYAIAKHFFELGLKVVQKGE